MKKSNLMLGLILIMLGLIVLLNALEIASINIFFKGWWTLIIIVPCFVNIFKDEDKTGSIIGFVIGVFLLLGVRDIIDFSLVGKLVLPLILIICGISLLFKDRISASIKKEVKKLNKNSIDKVYSATFSGQNLKFDEELTNFELNAIFGGIKCNLRNSIIKEDIVINTSSIFGGITLYVPKDVEIKVISNSIFGGVSGNYNKNKDHKKIKTIYINATCLFGGVEIK